MHVICLARAVACIGHNTCLCRPQHLFTSATTPAYVSQCFDLHRPQHLSFTSATTPIYIGQCCDLHQPQHLSFASTIILAFTGHNTGHNTSMCQQKYMPASATTQACCSKNTGLCKQNSCLCWPEHWPASVKILACAGHNTKNSGLHLPQH